MVPPFRMVRSTSQNGGRIRFGSYRASVHHNTTLPLHSAWASRMVIGVVSIPKDLHSLEKGTDDATTSAKVGVMRVPKGIAIANLVIW